MTVWAILAAILSVLGGIFTIFSKGKSAGINETENLSKGREVKRANERNEIDHDVATGDDSNKRLRDKWSRD